MGPKERWSLGVVRPALRVALKCLAGWTNWHTASPDRPSWFWRQLSRAARRPLPPAAAADARPEAAPQSTPVPRAVKPMAKPAPTAEVSTELVLRGTAPALLQV